MMKTAFVVKPSDAEMESRHTRIFDQLIAPICQALDYQLGVLDPGGNRFKIMDPVASPVYTSSLVIVDLGVPPYDPAVLMAAGYRRGSGRPIVNISPHSAESVPILNLYSASEFDALCSSPHEETSAE